MIYQQRMIFLAILGSSSLCNAQNATSWCNYVQIIRQGKNIILVQP